MTPVVHEWKVSPQPARVFVTGASGFIGRRICDGYRAAGVEVRGVDVQSAPELGVVAGDIAEPGEWQRRVAGCELVVHTAALVSMTAGMDRFWRVNTLGTRRVLDAAVAADVGRFVHLSSVTVFGFVFPDGVDETYPVRLTGVPYVDTKIAGEQVVLQAHGAGEIVCTVIRPGDLGPSFPSTSCAPPGRCCPPAGEASSAPSTPRTWSTASYWPLLPAGPRARC
jgi:nucleoside-diphosphate-sugar epimerase